LKMPGLTGIEVLRAAKAIAPDVDVILLTAFGTVEEAVKAMKDGAYDFLTKPFRREQLLKLISKALERRDLIEQNRALQQRLDDLLQQGAVIGSSPAFRRTMALVEQVADSSATVLIQGESGTGKELVARSRKASSSASAARRPSASTFASSRRRIRTSPKWYGRSGSARTCTTGSTSSRSPCRRSASDARTSASSPSTSCASMRRRTIADSRASPTKPSVGSRRTPGPGTCASSRTSSSAASCSPRARDRKSVV